MAIVQIKDLKKGNKIEALKFGKKVIGVITKIHPGAVVIVNEVNDELEVIDADRIKKILE